MTSHAILYFKPKINKINFSQSHQIRFEDTPQPISSCKVIYTNTLWSDLKQDPDHDREQEVDHLLTSQAKRVITAAVPIILIMEVAVITKGLKAQKVNHIKSIDLALRTEKRATKSTQLF